MQKGRRGLLLALILSATLHLLMLLWVPRVPKLWVWPTRKFEPKEEENTVRFELVEIPTEKEKPADENKAPYSDMDRRAHGGMGEKNAKKPRTVQNPQNRPAQVPRPPQPPSVTRKTTTSRRNTSGSTTLEKPTPPPLPKLALPPAGVHALPPAISGGVDMPSKRGGMVDTGSVSFDTRWFDWGPYAAAMLSKIKKNWIIPEIARLGVQGVVKIRFYIERDGTVTGLQILSESGKPPMDFAARDAIRRSSPFAPLPKEVDVDREGVTITFYYNCSPEDFEGR